MDLDLYTGAIDMIEYLDSTKPCPSFEGAYTEWVDELSEIELGSEESNIDTYIDLVGDLLKLFVQSATSKWSEKPVEERLNHVRSLFDRPNVAQRTKEWYEQSRKVLTASEFSAILGTPRAVATLAFQKTLPPRESSSSACPTASMGAMDWGVRFEPVVKQILEKMWKGKILDIGRLIHPTDTKLAASPDGLIESAEDEARVGRLLEIKCPIKRVINNMVPFEYWCQMQIQMEVANIDECEYVEMKLVSPYKDEPYNVQDVEHSGKVWIVQNPDNCTLVYAYTDDELKEFEEKGYAIIETVPWHLERMFNKVIPRDKAWFEGTAEKREEFWKIVEETNETTYVPPAKKAKKEIVTVCKIMDD